MESLGLKQFRAPQFSIPSIPADERALHKIKDVASFLNSIQWKSNEEQPKEPEPNEVSGEYNLNDPRTAFDWTSNGLDSSLGDPSQRIGETKFDSLDMSDLRELGNQSLLHSGAINFATPEYDWNLDAPMSGYRPLSSLVPNISYDRGSNSVPSDTDEYEQSLGNKGEKFSWTGKYGRDKQDALVDSVPGIDPIFMRRVGY